MSYIDIDIIIDEVAYDLNDQDDIAQYSSAVDRKIEIECALNNVRIDEIPVDGDGYTTSRILQEYGILTYKKLLFQGYAGSSDGDAEDVYSSKVTMLKDDLREIETKLTRESILGLFDDGGEPKGRLTTVRTIPMVNGAISPSCGTCEDE